jgi:hypothetical protein
MNGTNKPRKQKQAKKNMKTKIFGPATCICNSTGKETVLIAGELGAFNCKLFMEA